VHQVLKNVLHAKRIRLLLQAFSGEQGVERAVDVGADLQIVVLHHLGQHLQHIELLEQLLAHVLPLRSQGQVHQQRSGVLEGIIR